MLKTAGYTTAIFGKWHLGDEKELWPSARGFDEMFIHGGGGIGQTYPGTCGDAPGNKYFDPAILHNGTFEKKKGFCTDVFFTQAEKWIESVKGRPFYCYIATNAPHAPYNARPEDAALYRGLVGDDATAGFFGMLHNIDENVGKLLAKLGEWGIEKDTLVVFMNDNGTAAGEKVFNAGMRGKKGTPWLGGTRASSFWRWPGTFTPADCGALTAHIDFFPTISELTGAKLTANVQTQVEGRSLVPLLRNPTAPWPERVLFTHVGRWPVGANVDDFKYSATSVRSGQWHLVSAGNPNKPQAKAWQLFDLKADPGEQTNVAAEHGDVVQRLDAAYDDFWQAATPLMVNETAHPAEMNPFKELYWKQFGLTPTAAELNEMKFKAKATKE